MVRKVFQGQTTAYFANLSSEEISIDIGNRFRKSGARATHAWSKIQRKSNLGRSLPTFTGKSFCFNNIKMRHLENRTLGKCLVSYWFVNLKLFHPEQRDFDQSNMRFLETRKMYFSDIEILRLCLFQSHPCLKRSNVVSNTLNLESTPREETRNLTLVVRGENPILI